MGLALSLVAHVSVTETEGIRAEATEAVTMGMNVVAGVVCVGRNEE